MLKNLMVVAALVVSSQATFAGFDDFAVVLDDKTLATAGTTREAYNKKNPDAEKRWRAAWAAEGTKKDKQEFVRIRAKTTRPADLKPSAAATATEGR